MPGLIRGVARTAVVAGTATAVSGRVSRRQANKWAQQGSPTGTPAYMAPVPQQQYQAPPPQYEAAPPQYEPEEPSTDEMIAQLQKLAQLRDAGVLTEQEFGAQKARILNG